MSRNEWMTARQAANRLRVKPETLYAYVSRGLLDSERTPGERTSRYRRRDVERLAERRRGGGRAGNLDIVLETDLTLLDPGGRLYYRGWDAEEAATGARFEEVATWLWTGERADVAFEAPPGLASVARRVSDVLPDHPAIDRLRAVVAAVRAEDPLRDDRRPRAVAAAGRGLVAALVESLPPAGHGDAPTEGSIAERLWPRVSPMRATAKRIRLLNAALVLLADHELAASTLAARVAASTWADPYLVVQAGLAALGGPLHGGASAGARDLIAEVERGDATAAEAIGSRLRDGGLVLGFGHRVYESRDPRAEAILHMLDAAGARPLATGALVETMADRGLPFPNIDFAMASVAEAHDMIPAAPETIFAVARVAGWLAHALEEYQHRMRFRPRAAYTGPRP